MTATVLPIGRVAKVKSGYAFKSADWQANGVPVVKIANVRDGRVTLEGCSFVSEEVAHSARAFELGEGDILISMTGYIGEIGRVRNQGRMLLNQRVGRFTVTQPDRLDVDFLYYALQDPDLKQRFVKHGYGAAQPNISPTLIEQQEIALPPLADQRRIAGILSAYDDLIENCQRRIRILEEMARRLYREWFVHFRYPGHESILLVDSPLGPIPQGWEVKKLREFGQVITGKTPSTVNSDFYGDDMQFVKTPDMHGSMFVLTTSDSLSTSGARSQANKTLPAGSICVSCIGTIGVVSITTQDCQTNQQINSLVLASAECREFLYFRLQDAKQALENLGSNGATMGNVNKGKFEALELICPREDLLGQYHQVVSPMFSEILCLSREAANLRRTRDLLLPRLLNGGTA